MTVRILVGDALSQIKTLDAESVQCCVTSPPYWGLRDYGVEGQLGLEKTPDEYVGRMVAVFAEVRRVLRKDGTLWLNIGDSYAGSGKGGNPEAGKQATNRGSQSVGVLYETGKTAREAAVTNVTRLTFPESGIKAKDLVGIPWMLAFALRADGWYLRSDIIWAKPNPMPESVTDRPTSAHEHVFLLSKDSRYFYDADAIARPVAESQVGRVREDVIGGNRHLAGAQHSKGGTYKTDKQRGHSRRHAGFNDRWDAMPKEEQCATANARNVWTIATHPYPEAHFATFPPALAETCIRAGSAEGQTVLDPFGGAGTTGLVADRLSRNALLIELNPAYAELSRARIHNDNPMFTTVEVA